MAGADYILLFLFCQGNREEAAVPKEGRKE
jgi:hypothetical protein